MGDQCTKLLLLMLMLMLLMMLPWLLSQVLVRKDPSLLGKMFEVEITATGKHFLRGSVLDESVVHVLPLACPLLPGEVSGAAKWASRTSPVSPSPPLPGSPSPPSPRRQLSLDVCLVLATCVALTAFLLRFVT